MNFTSLSHHEYKKLVPRTMSYNFYVDKNVNIVQKDSRLTELHCAIGLMTEMEELSKAIMRFDKVNIGEELGDAFWYPTNLENIIGLDFSSLEVPLTLASVSNLFTELSNDAGKILDIYKKAFFYNSPIDHNKLANLLRNVHVYMHNIAMEYQLDVGVIKAKNINKLWVRFPDKFTDYHAQNRDLTAEMQTLT